MKKYSFNVLSITLLLFIVFTSACDSSNNNSSSVNQSDSSNLTNSNNVSNNNWNYQEQSDTMTGKREYFATTTSTNKLDFKFPYGGGSTCDLTVRNVGNGNEIVFSVSKGQFMPSLSSDEYVSVKFDSSAPMKYTYNSAEDGSSDVIFFDSPNKFLTLLKNAKKIMIEAPFFNEGRDILYFNVNGLKWNK